MLDKILCNYFIDRESPNSVCIPTGIVYEGIASSMLYIELVYSRYDGSPLLSPRRRSSYFEQSRERRCLDVLVAVVFLRRATSPYLSRSKWKGGGGIFIHVKWMALIHLCTSGEYCPAICISVDHIHHFYHTIEANIL